MPQNGVLLDQDEVKRRREALLLTQPQAAARLGITPNTLSLIEASSTYRTSFKTVHALADLFGCEATDLVRRDEVA